MSPNEPTAPAEPNAAVDAPPQAAPDMVRNITEAGDASGRGSPRTRSNRFGLLGSELSTLFRRLRTLAILACLAGVPVLLAMAVKLFSGPSGPEEGPPFLYQVASNGLFVALTGLVVTLPLFLPLAVGVVAGDSLAGEANQGTLRYLLVVPTGRVRLLLVKLASALTFCLVAAFTVALAGMAIGAVLFPLGPVTLLSGDTIGPGAAFGRGLLVAGYLGLSLSGLAAVGVFISTLTDVPIAAMAATVALAIISQIVDSIPQLDAVHPWLLSHYWLAFGDLLREPIYTPLVARGLLLQLGYVVVFGLLAWARFSSRDILS